MQNQLVIAVMARDRVGIIADVTSEMQKLGGNLADLSQTVLCGYFTMIIVATFPDGVDANTVRLALTAIPNDDGPFDVGIREPVGPLATEDRDPAGDRYILTAVGPDKIGLVAAVTSYLCTNNINIDDLTTRVDDGFYTMILSLAFPENTHVGHFKEAMRDALLSIGVNVEIQHHDIFRATNET